MNKQELIEKAVMDWDGEFKADCDIVYEYSGPRSYAACARSYLGNRECLFTREEFNAAADRLRGKPDWSEAPHWAKSLAQDSNGKWYWYSVSAIAHNFGWCSGGESKFSRHGKVIGDWRNTLEKRPEQKVEANESASNWFELGELPPVGERFEAYFERDDAPKWNAGNVAYKSDEHVILKFDEGQENYYDAKSLVKIAKFRPIRTEREKFIEAALAKTAHVSDQYPAISKSSAVNLFGDMFDAGFKAPEVDK